MSSSAAVWLAVPWYFVGVPCLGLLGVNRLKWQGVMSILFLRSFQPVFPGIFLGTAKLRRLS
jgi:hypothetical protein